MKIRRAVIPAAGLGIRFLPATKSQPKEMLTIVDKPALHYIVEEAVNAGIEEILIVTRRDKGSIENYFDRSIELELELENIGEFKLLEEIQKISNMAKIYYTRQSEPLGLGHAIYCAKTFVGDEAFAVLLGDDIIYSHKPCIGQMMEIYERYETSILGVRKMERDELHRYGNLQGDMVEDRIYGVKKLIEKPRKEEIYSNIAVLGRYIITPGIFDVLEHLKPGRDGEIQLTDGLNELAQREMMYAYEFEGTRYDIGDKQGFLEANIGFALRDRNIREGVIEYLRKVTGEYGKKEN
ncbi:UTP--glucose-1-phosphate uridylyltransferase GalU [Tissierellaceae bacterium HCP3S3_D8]